MSVVPVQKEIGVWYNPLTWPGDIANGIQWLGIPAWVWLIGAGAVVYILTRDDKPDPQVAPSIQIVDMTRRRRKTVTKRRR